MLNWTGLACTLATLIWSSLAFAQDPRVAQARKDCLTGDVESGVALLADLFVETKDPNLIYNQARCYEQNGRAAEAILRFREYLRVAKDLTAADRTEVDRHIADCRAMQAERRSAGGTPPPEPPEVTTPPTVDQPTAPPVAETAAPASPGKTRGSGKRIAGIIVGGAGIASLVTGGIFSYLVSSAEQEAEDNAKIGVYDSSLNSRGKSYETAQWVCYGAGAALVATGVVLYVLGTRGGSRGKTVAVIPSVAPGQGGVLLRGSY